MVCVIFNKPTSQQQFASWIWIGAASAVLGNLFYSIGLFLQRYVHKNNVLKLPYTQLPMWWLGLLGIGLGQLGNFVAYGMAPASLVAPLGGITVVFNAILSRLVLKEEDISWKGVAGIGLALGGSVLIVMNTPSSQSQDKDNHDQHSRFVYDHLISWRSFAYLTVVLVMSLFIANPCSVEWGITDDYAKKHVIWYCVLCGLIGAITVISSKAISTALHMAFAGHPAMFSQPDICWLTYVLFITLGGSVVLQIKFLNMAMMNFGSNLVVPTFYIAFTCLSISAGMVVFLEISFSPFVTSLVLFCTGLILAFIGVYLIGRETTASSTTPTMMMDSALKPDSVKTTATVWTKLETLPVSDTDDIDECNE